MVSFEKMLRGAPYELPIPPEFEAVVSREDNGQIGLRETVPATVARESDA